MRRGSVDSGQPLMDTQLLTIRFRPLQSRQICLYFCTELLELSVLLQRSLAFNDIFVTLQ